MGERNSYAPERGERGVGERGVRILSAPISLNTTLLPFSNFQSLPEFQMTQTQIAIHHFPTGERKERLRKERTTPQGWWSLPPPSLRFRAFPLPTTYTPASLAEGHVLFEKLSFHSTLKRPARAR